MIKIPTKVQNTYPQIQNTYQRSKYLQGPVGILNVGILNPSPHFTSRLCWLGWSKILWKMLMRLNFKIYSNLEFFSLSSAEKVEGQRTGASDWGGNGCCCQKGFHFQACLNFQHMGRSSIRLNIKYIYSALVRSISSDRSSRIYRSLL